MPYSTQDMGLAPTKFTKLLPTYVIRVSSPKWGALEKVWIANAVGEAIGKHGASITDAIGLWEGKQEREVTITIQCNEPILQRVFLALGKLPDIRYAHVEKHEVPTAYVDLEEWRMYG